MEGTTDEVQALKDKGNKCCHEGKFEEAVLHYTYAIKLYPKNATLYSNRSLAFLKVMQYYFAFEDALETIRLKPDWAKGYFRKGEVESATFQYKDALKSYRLALILLPNDPTIENAISQATNALNKNTRADEQVPWVGAGVGIVIGVSIVIADQILVSKSYIHHPILMALLTVAIALLGFAIGKAIRFYVSCQRKGLLEPPLDLFQGSKETTSTSETDGKTPEGKSSSGHAYHRYTKAQARHKLRKGKT